MDSKQAHDSLAKAAAARRGWQVDAYTVYPVRRAHASYLPGNYRVWGQVWGDPDGWRWSVWRGAAAMQGLGNDGPSATVGDALAAVEAGVALVTSLSDGRTVRDIDGQEIPPPVRLLDSTGQLLVHPALSVEGAARWDQHALVRVTGSGLVLFCACGHQAESQESPEAAFDLLVEHALTACAACKGPKPKVIARGAGAGGLDTFPRCASCAA